MSCFAVTIAACFKLSGIYVDAALIHSNAGEGEFVSSSSQPTDRSVWYTPDGETFQVFDRTARNPYARIAIGYSVQWSASWSTRLDYSHESSIASRKDFGANRFTLGITWRPFGGSP